MKLTLPQQDVYFEQLLYPNEPIYNIGAKIEIKGKIDVDVFNKAYCKLIDQHDAYRSILTQCQDSAEITIQSIHNSELGFVDFSNQENPEELANSYMQKEFVQPFDLYSNDLLHVFMLVKVNDNFHYLFSVYHHIITDGWGTSLMFRRLVKNYNEIAEFGTVQTDYPYSYEEFASEDTEYENSDSYAKDKEYWLGCFDTFPENLFDKKEESVSVIKNDRKELILKRSIYNQLNELSKGCKSSTFHVILAILYLYFGRKHQNKDFAIGLPVLNRSKRSYKNTVGLFMGVSPLRMQLDFEQTFEELVNIIKNQLRQDYRHQRFPLGKLVKELQAFKEKERIFNITLSYEKQDYSTNFLNTKTRVIPMTHGAERVALAIYIREFDESEDVKIDFDYNLNYFDNSEISQVVSHFENLVNQILVCPDKKLKEFSYLKEVEKRQLLHDFNDTRILYPKGKTVIDIFKNQVKEAPEKIAITDDNVSYTYSELDKDSNQIASYLKIAYGLENKSPIGVLLDRSATMVAVLLGILKSGRPYIPLDPTFPKDRLKYIIDESKPELIIREKKCAKNDIEGVSFQYLEEFLAKVESTPTIEPILVLPSDTAYVIYTSGSTGNPKGVEIGHRSLHNFLISMLDQPGMDTRDTLFSVTTYSFDISILEFFAPLISGSTLYVTSQNILSDPNLVIQKLEEIKPTIIQATPGFYQMLFNAGWKGNMSLKVLCGGDLLSESLAKQLLEHNKELWNMYGPTETTIWSSIKKITKGEEAATIGKPINNTQFYIVDDFFNPLPIGTPGAIYIGGDGLAKGYYKNRILTKEKFIENPFVKGELIYETGDVGSWNKIGEIEFLGRNDNQIKIRGYRIELGDIETKLNEISGIKETVVLAKKGEQQEAFLVAFIVFVDEELNSREIIKTLKQNLPEYMIPYTIIPVEEFPLTPNKKIDRKSLLKRSIRRDIVDSIYKTANTTLEKKLTSLWSTILNVNSEISITDNFFALGGHSLNAVRLIGLIREELFYDIPLKTIFDYPTIQSLAECLENLIPNQQAQIPISQTKDFYPITPAQYNIWLASQKENMSVAYNMSSAYTVEGTINEKKLRKSIQYIIRKHEILRTNFVERGGIPYQKINPEESVDFTIITKDVIDSDFESAIDQVVHSVFDLERDLLLRVYLFRKDTEKYTLVFSTHHIIMDGWSLEIFAKELISNYNVDGLEWKEKESVALGFQFKDYSEYMNQFLETKKTENGLFWNAYLKNYKYKNSFNTDYKPSKNQQKGNKIYFELSKEKTIKLKEFIARTNITTHTFLTSVLNSLIYKMSNHTDVCIGTVNSGRNLPELHHQIGMFVKTVVLRTIIDSEDPFIVLLKKTQANLLELDNYQDVSFDKMTQSIFDIILVYQNPDFSPENIIELEDFTLNFFPTKEKYSRLPMLFNFSEKENMLNGVISYNTEMYQKETIQLIILKFTKLLEEIIKNPTITIKEIDISLEIEKHETFDFEFNF